MKILDCFGIHTFWGFGYLILTCKSKEKYVKIILPISINFIYSGIFFTIHKLVWISTIPVLIC